MLHFDVSEGIARGHPDKIADQISDAILDACLRQDPSSRVAVETLVSHGLVAIGGEVTTSAHFDPEKIVKEVLHDIGYEGEMFQDFLSRLHVVTMLCEQSPDISQSVGKKGMGTSVAAGDQGTTNGFACTDTPTLMPRSYEIARSIVKEVQALRTGDMATLLGPDGKTQVAIDLGTAEKKGGSVVLSWQHHEKASLEEVRAILGPVVTRVSEEYGFSPDTVLINPSGRFVLGGPLADTGLTGRKQIADSYGSSVRHGGGAYSGKDATKVDRTGAYMARYVAKHVVAAGLAAICEIQLIFSIGRATPLAIGIDCFGTEKRPLAQLKKAIEKTFAFSVSEMIQELRLTTPFFQTTAHGGHFGREEFPWEQLPHLDALVRFL